MKKRVYYCTFPGMWMEGHAIVVAKSPDEAKNAVVAEMEPVLSLTHADVEVDSIDMRTRGVHNKYDGDY